MSGDRTDTSFLEHDLAASAPGARLVVEEPGRSPRVVTVPPGGEARAGRGDELEIALDDARASRCHAVFAFDGRVVTVRDLGSSNGTFVGERRVEGSARVERGDVVRVGATRIAVLIAARDDAAQRAGAGGDVVAVDPATVALFALVRRVAARDLPVLVRGETGSGKEVVARALHRYSPRAAGPFVAVNCAALPDALAESELFGHEKGAFTGAHARRPGVFEAAHGGTLLLDEVGELSAGNQARLLRALEERVVVRLGGTEPVPVDVRVVAATHRDLAQAAAQGRFREDLYFRLDGLTIAVPPLRARPGDVVPLVERVLAGHAGRFTLGPGFAATLRSYRWPGNVRELRNAVEHAAALSYADGVLRVEHLPPAVRGEACAGGEHARDEGSPLRDRVDGIERSAIIAALEATGWNQSRAARELGISRRALIYKMERHGLKPPPASEG